MNYETTIEAEQVAADRAAYEAGEATPVRGKRTVIVAVVLVIAAIAAAWFLMRGGATAPAANPDAQAPTVTVVTPGRVTIDGTITASGTLAARRLMPVGVAGEGGQVVSVLVDAGDWVGQGQVLAVIDRSVQTQQAASQSANIQVAEADLRLAEANLQRALKLVDRGFISKADVDRLTATRDAAAARVRVARASLGELNARTARLNIVAPAAGFVLERKVEPGQVVSSGSGVLFSIAKGGEMELAANLSETDLAALSVGESAEIVPVGTDKTFIGQIWQLSPVIDQTSRQGKARVALAYDPALRPGGFASARIKSGTVVAPILPESAILSDNQGSFVYVLGQDNKVQRRPIRTGTVTEQGIAIVEGLSGSERVVLRAGGFLSPGEKVNPQSAPQTPQPAPRTGG
jgi:RND family efflux transporter MFP subunit